MHALSRYERWYGRDEPPVKRRRVQAGHLTAELEGADLRYVRAGGIEVVRRLYAAVRDQNWGTVPPVLSNVELDVEDDRFGLRFDAHHVDEPLGVDFTWRGELTGGADGTLTYTLDGVANKAFRYNRIGWCILHPAQNAGRRFRARSPDRLIEDRLPAEIGPQLIVDGLPAPLFASFDELEIEVADGVWARFKLEGDLFETEDQRNWTDASFKTYSTPLALGFPHDAEAGRRFRQSVRLTLAGAPAPAAPNGDVTAEIRLGEPAGRLPALGLGAASHGRPLSEREAGLLAAAGLAHLRVDVDPKAGDWREALARGAADARAIGAALEVAVFVPDDPTALDAVAEALREEGCPVARVLAFRRGEPTSSAQTVQYARERLGRAAGGAAVAGGTNILFTDLNRFRPDVGPADGIAWPLNATVHADDDTSVVETAAMHGETVRSARAFCGDRPLHVTPVTFNQRFNPVAMGPELEPEPGRLPPQVDRRQLSLLGAGWTIASLRHLAEAGAASVTYFETTGWRGLIETEDGPAVPDRFSSWPGMVFPAYHVLTDVGEWKHGELLAVEATAPLAVEALAVRTDRCVHVLVASLAPKPQRCRIAALPAGSVTARRLDEASFAAASSDASAFRAEAEPVAADGELELAPYAVVRLDFTP